MEEFAKTPLSVEPDAPEASETAKVGKPETIAESVTETPSETPPVTETASEIIEEAEPEMAAENACETPSETQAAAGSASETASETQAAAEAIEEAAPEAAAQAVTDEESGAARSDNSRAKRLRKQQRRRWIFGFVCGVAFAGALAVGARIWEQRRAASQRDLFFWDFRESMEENDSQEDLSVKIPTWPLGDGPAFGLVREYGDSQTAQEVYRNVNPSVVTVIVELSDEKAAVGTGVIFSDDGYFVTNYHVIQGGVKCRAMLDSGRSYPALFVAGDERDDLAVLKMDDSGPFPAAQFGDSERLTVGDTVYAIGNPLGIEFRGTLTDGIVSAIDRDVMVDGRTMTLLQTNAALNSGNSGGPLINEYGQVVGINVVKMSSRRSTVEGLGFAIPSASMERLVNDLLTYGESKPEPVIGVSVDSFGTEVEPDLWGIGVLKVEPDSPAEAAGIQVGDYIIAADNETISGSRDLLRVRRRYHAGESMSVTLWRDGERLDAVIAFAE